MDNKGFTGRAMILVSQVFYFDSVYKLIRRIYEYDKELYEHSLWVAYLSAQLCLELNKNETETLKIIAGALLHDIGKTGIDLTLLTRHRKLTEDEFREVKKHTIIGKGIITGMDLPYVVTEIVEHHHEREDGSGYPDGIKGLSEALNIVAVADSFEAMTAERPYGEILSAKEAIERLKNDKTKYSIKVIEALEQCRVNDIAYLPPLG